MKTLIRNKLGKRMANRSYIYRHTRSWKPIMLNSDPNDEQQPIQQKDTETETAMIARTENVKQELKSKWWVTFSVPLKTRGTYSQIFSSLHGSSSSESHHISPQQEKGMKTHEDNEWTNCRVYIRNINNNYIWR